MGRSCRVDTRRPYNLTAATSADVRRRDDPCKTITCFTLLGCETDVTSENVIERLLPHVASECGDRTLQDALAYSLGGARSERHQCSASLVPGSAAAADDTRVSSATAMSAGFLYTDRPTDRHRRRQEIKSLNCIAETAA